MSKVITFSRYFPATHPKKGQPTFFVEKIFNSLDLPDYKIMTLHDLYGDEINPTEDEFMSGSCNPLFDHKPKYHTVRAGSRWKVGDKFSPRVWSGKPYQSKQIIIAPDIEIKKIWNIDIMHAHSWFSVMINGKENHWHELAKNDGLSSVDFMDWFKKSNNIFIGQIICWNENIKY